MDALLPYRSDVGGLATRHRKLPLIAPTLLRHTGLRVVGVDVDTDSLGTFSGEVARPGDQWETAVAKARLGMRHSGYPIGLASEGVIAPLPAAPLVLACIELVLLVDDRRGIVIGETAQALGPPAISVDVTPDELNHADLERAGFPEHGVIVRPTGGWTPMTKGLHTTDELMAEVARCASASAVGTAHVESDFRAMHHPFRRRVIAAAAERLARRLAERCPVCCTPGWGVGRVHPGAPCRACHTATRLPLFEDWTCGACDHVERRSLDSEADPSRCPRCNP